MNGRRHNGL